MSIQDVIDYENGDLSEEDTADLFQRMINSGDVWALQGAYGRAARDMIDAGWCVLGEHQTHDYYGNFVPSRFQVHEGTPGSISYAKKVNPEFRLYTEELH
jgi:hypothetical protein